MILPVTYPSLQRHIISLWQKEKMLKLGKKKSQKKKNPQRNPLPWDFPRSQPEGGTHISLKSLGKTCPVLFGTLKISN